MNRIERREAIKKSIDELFSDTLARTTLHVLASQEEAVTDLSNIVDHCTMLAESLNVEAAEAEEE